MAQLFIEIILGVVVLFACAVGPSTQQSLNGVTTFSSVTTLYKKDTPHRFLNDVVVLPTAILTLEAGVEIRVAPAMEFLVYGTLIARGNTANRIVFTKLDGARPDLTTTPPWPSDVRLVNGSSVSEGVLQLNYKGNWRSVCSNYVNWTGDDANATCRQLGFAKAYNFTYNYTTIEEELQMALPSPRCSGSESSLKSCAGFQDRSIIYGRNICNQQRTLYLRCERVRPDLATDYWLGIKLYNSTSKKNIGAINESASIFEYVDIFYAGVNKTRHPVAALSASPFVPQLNNVRLMWNAYDALNFSEVNSTISISNCEIAYNRGHGMNITTYFGLVRLLNNNVHHNYGDGVYVRVLDQVYRLWEWRSCDICGNCPLGAYPALITGDVSAQQCVMKVTNNNVNTGGFLSIVLLEAYRDVAVSRAWLSLYNGDCSSQLSMCGKALAPPLIEWDLSNTTVDHPLPQSLATSVSIVTIVFRVDKLYLPSQCLNVLNCVRYVFLIDQSSAAFPGIPSADMALASSQLTDNMLHGVLVENVRSYVYVNNSVISRNLYGAGLRIRGGAADTYIGNSVFTNNQDTGINITFSGGRTIVQNVVIENNRGIGFWLKPVETFKARLERHQKTEILNTSISYNDGIGLKAGNYCGDSLLVMNTSSQFFANGGSAIEFISCYMNPPAPNNFSLEYVTFSQNGGLAVRICPMVNLVGIIKNCSFLGHTGGTIRIDNTDDLQRSRVYISQQVTYSVESNYFFNNSGKYVVYLRLTELSTIHQLWFRYNHLVGNLIPQAYPGLNPRSRAEAVIVVSSSNVLVNRNEIINPGSVRQIATHSLSVTVTINVQYNWWGYKGGQSVDIASLDDYHAMIFRSLLDSRKRYNLASVEYYPALKSFYLFSNDYSNVGNQKYIDQFRRDVNGITYIGGFLQQSSFTLPRANYVVDVDINVGPGTRLIVNSGATLQFASTVGLLVQGELQVATDGGTATVIFDRRDAGVVNASNSSGSANDSSSVGIRLTGGATPLEGYLEVLYNGQWGTVCNRGWTIRETALVCAQLGFTVHPLDSTPDLPVRSASDRPVLLSAVQCTDEDTTLLQCTADLWGQFSGCDHTMDVALRCVQLTWAGARLTAIAVRSELRNLNISRAGLFDYATYSYVPSLQLDYNSHTISNIAVQESSLSGIKIVYNDPYNTNSIVRSTFSNNIAYGVQSMDTCLTLLQCTFAQNGLAGYSYDPHITELDAFDVRQWITGQDITMIDQTLTSFQIKDRGKSYFFSSVATGLVENFYLKIQIQAANYDQKVTVKVLDYSPIVNTESFTFYDSSILNMNAPGVKVINAEDDLVEMPFVSSSQYVTFVYNVSGVRSGRLMLVISSRASGDVPESGFDFPATIRAATVVSGCAFTQNAKGIVSAHYNNPSNMYNDLFSRHRFENFLILSSTFTSNKQEAIYVPSVTKYSDYYMPTVQDLMYPFRICNITFQVANCTFTDNGNGIVADHNHVDFSNNIWRWQYVNNDFNYNRAGGLVMELPIILNPYSNGNHSVDVNGSSFTNNAQFEFSINGGFANLTIFGNAFQNNVARKGLITMSGMEKCSLVAQNAITNNNGKYMVQFDISSHAMYGVSQPSEFVYNQLQGNWYAGASASLDTYSVSSSYSIGIRGVQSVNVTRNLIGDSSMGYSLVADMITNTIDLTLNATYNWWGTTDSNQINAKIFDFKDWNSFALVQYSPVLQQANFRAEASDVGNASDPFDLSKPLRGLITMDTVIPPRATPYSVVQDITVMPGVTVTILPGVEFRIQPNVGFLVLGRLLANGVSSQHIKFLPADKSLSSDVTPGRKRRDFSYSYYSGSNGSYAAIPLSVPPGNCTKTGNPTIWLCGGERPNEGFLVLYNASSRAWSLVCDPQFNDRTAQVFCKEMGYDWENVHVATSDLFEYYTYNYVLYLFKDLWTRTFLCEGTEGSIDECSLLINYNLQVCAATQQYVFVRCGKRNLPNNYDYWGNIRFAFRSYEKPTGPRTDVSSLLNVDIYGAGILHELKRAAVESTYQSVVMSNINVSNCAFGGFQFTVPLDDTLLLNSYIQNNLGYGVGVLVLNGQANPDVSSPSQSTFVALNESTIPYRTYGLIDMCSAGKFVDIDSRALIYYKYDFFSRDCVKVIRNKAGGTLGIRFLQLGMYYDNFTRNYIEIFDGPDFSPRYSMRRLWSQSSDTDRRSMYKTTTYFSPQRNTYLPQNQMGLQVHASPASGQNGFIAEVVSLPTPSTAYPGTDGTHKIIGTVFFQNEGGSVRYDTVGEQNPSFIAVGNTFQNNGLDVLNLTSRPNILLNTQNVIFLSVSNNFISGNNGSVSIWLYSDRFDTRYANANISNNVFVYNINGETLKIGGNYLKRIAVLFNYFARNVVQYLNTLDIHDVIANLTGNILYKNTGAHILDLWGTPMATDMQIVYKNQFYNNTPGDKYQGYHFSVNNTALFTAGYSKNISQNVFYNTEFFYELETFNRSLSERPYATVNPQLLAAAYNFWGNLKTVPDAVNASIWDYHDDYNLTGVQFMPFYPNNFSIVEGFCFFGYMNVNNRCYRYFGGVATYSVASQVCRLENARLAEPENDSPTSWQYLGTVLKAKQQDYSNQLRAWVSNPVGSSGSTKCPVVIDLRYDEADCSERLPFICELDQSIVDSQPYLLPLGIGLGVTGFVILVALLFVLCWCAKSRQRKQQLFERRASVRSSNRSTRLAVSNATLSSSAAILSRPTTPSRLKLNGATLNDTQTDTLETTKSKLDQFGLNVDQMSENGSETPLQQGEMFGYGNITFRESPDAMSNPQLDHEVSTISRPLYGNVVYENGDNSSVDMSRNLSRLTEKTAGGVRPVAASHPAPLRYRDAGHTARRASIETFDSLATLDTIAKDSFHRSDSRETLDTVRKEPFHRAHSRETLDTISQDSRLPLAPGYSIRPYQPPAYRPPENVRQDQLYRSPSRDVLDHDGAPQPLYRPSSRDILDRTGAPQPLYRPPSRDILDPSGVPQPLYRPPSRDILDRNGAPQPLYRPSSRDVVDRDRVAASPLPHASSGRDAMDPRRPATGSRPRARSQDLLDARDSAQSQAALRRDAPESLRKEVMKRAASADMLDSPAQRRHMPIETDIDSESAIGDHHYAHGSGSVFPSPPGAPAHGRHASPLSQAPQWTGSGNLYGQRSAYSAGQQPRAWRSAFSVNRSSPAIETDLDDVAATAHETNLDDVEESQEGAHSYRPPAASGVPVETMF